MKNSLLIKSLFLGVFFVAISNGCSAEEEALPALLIQVFEENDNQIVFNESAAFKWGNKKVEVSFEDDFQKFLSINSPTVKGLKVGYLLSENNLRQGFTIKLKITDTIQHAEKTSEIMIEPYDLSRGINQFTIGYNGNTPSIIY